MPEPLETPRAQIDAPTAPAAPAAPAARAFDSHLPPDTIRAIHRAAISLGLAAHAQTLLASLPETFIASIETPARLDAALLLLLFTLNKIERLEGGQVPLSEWLTNAIQLSTGRQEQKVFRQALEEMNAAAPRAAKARLLRPEPTDADIESLAKVLSPPGRTTGATEKDLHAFLRAVGRLQWIRRAPWLIAMIVVIVGGLVDHTLWWWYNGPETDLKLPETWNNPEQRATIDDSLFTLTGREGPFDLIFGGDVAICHAATQGTCPITTTDVAGFAHFELRIQYRVGNGDYEETVCRGSWDAVVEKGNHNAYVKEACRVGKIRLKRGETLQVRVDDAKCWFNHNQAPCIANLDPNDSVFRFYVKERPW